MRQFSRPSPIDRLSLEARVVYSVFCAFMLLGYGTGVWFWLDDDLGLGAEGTRTYYLGEAAPAPVEAPSGDGPALELPEDLAPARPLRVEKPARVVIETFHFHLFSVSVCLMILAHLFMMCGVSRRLKMIVLIGGSLGTTLHLLVPVLVRFASPSLAFLMFPSALVMGVSWLFMTLWPLWEMWRAPMPAAAP